MTALQIEEQKAFTENLFIGELFDRFLVREASFVTYNSFLIDGRVRQGYYSEEELELQKIEEFSAWKVLKPFCYSLIRGKRLPESFRIVFLCRRRKRRGLSRPMEPGWPRSRSRACT